MFKANDSNVLHVQLEINLVPVSPLFVHVQPIHHCLLFNTSLKVSGHSMAMYYGVSGCSLHSTLRAPGCVSVK